MSDGVEVIDADISQRPHVSMLLLRRRCYGAVRVRGAGSGRDAALNQVGRPHVMRRVG